MNAVSLNFRRKIITTSKIAARFPESGVTHHEEIDCDLRPNLHLARTTFPIILT
jgi:hypothetical protein